MNVKLFLFFYLLLINTYSSDITSKCFRQRIWEFPSKAKIEFCGEQKGSFYKIKISEDQTLTLPGNMRVFIKNDKNESNKSYKSLTHKHRWKKIEKSKVDRHHYVEYNVFSNAGLPVRIHNIDCSQKKCRKISESCALNESFAFPKEIVDKILKADMGYSSSPYDRRAYSDTAKDFIEKIVKNGCQNIDTPEGFQEEYLWKIIELFALTGNSSCQNKILNEFPKPGFNYTGSDKKKKETLLKQVKFVKDNCFSEKSPKRLPISHSKKIGRISPSTTTIFEVYPGNKTCTGCQEYDFIVPIFTQEDTAWTGSEGPSGYYDNFISDLTHEKKYIKIPAKVELNNRNYSYYEEYKYNSTLSLLEAGKILKHKISTNLDENKVFKIKSLSNEFTQMDFNRKMLAANHAKNNHEEWRLAKLPLFVLKKLRTEYIRIYKKKLKCIIDEENGNYLEDRDEKLTESDIEFHPKSYSSNNGKYIAGVKVNLPFCDKEEDPRNESYYVYSWFYVSGKEKELPRYFTSTSHKKRSGPFQAGDFDGDGKVEWIFIYDDSGDRLDDVDFYNDRTIDYDIFYNDFTMDKRGFIEDPIPWWLNGKKNNK